MTYISSPSFTAPLRSAVLQAQSALNQAQTEVSSGAPADIGLTLGASTGNLLSLRSQVDALNAFTASNATAATRLSTTANVLGSLLTSGQGASAALIAATPGGGITTALQSTAAAALNTLVAGLNTTVGNQSIFAGTKTTTASPVAADAGSATSAAQTALTASFQAFLAGPPAQDPSTLTGAQLQSYVDGPFAAAFSDANWQTNWSSASDTALQSTIAPGQSVATSVSANAAAFRQLAQGYSLITGLANAGLGTAAQATAITAATKLINAGLASLTQLQGGVGLSQAAVDTANTQLGAQVDLLQTNADNLDSVDTYALSGRVTSLQNQLEASYELTSRLQQLSLTNYLTG